MKDLYLVAPKSYGSTDAEWKLVKEEYIHLYAEGHWIHQITDTKPVKVEITIKKL